MNNLFDGSEKLFQSFDKPKKKPATSILKSLCKLPLFFLGIALSFLSVLGGIGAFVGLIAMSIFDIITMVKTTATFWGIFNVVLCWICAPLAGWLVFAICAFLAAMCYAFAK